MIRTILKLGVVLIALGAIGGYLSYKWIFEPNTNIEESYELYISSQSTFNELKDRLIQDSVLSNPWTFEQVSKLMKYGPEQIPSGKYIIEPGWSNRDIISTLRIGRQTPIKLTISTSRTIYDVIKVVADQIEPDSIQLAELFQDTGYIKGYGFSPESVIGMIIPDTYEMYWNTDSKGFFSKMKSEYDKYWAQGDREIKLEALGMTKNEVSTMASIVQKESNDSNERAMVAGVYINRIEKGMKLQADPTVVFGVGDFTIRRVLNKHLAYDSPYNTYMYKGLPPGPISMPEKSAINAVLNAVQHDYLFFCSKPGYGTQHAFAVTDIEHARNAARYHRWLNKERIMK